jgi:phospholipid-binding lipoprotein MlaA
MLALALLLLQLGGCATVGGGSHFARESTGSLGASPSDGDPLEQFNRSLFRIGMSIDRGIERPLAHAYLHLTNRGTRKAVHNVLNNLDEPVVFINDVLQVRPRRAGRSAVRFVTNSTVGVAGIIDLASKAGLERQDNDFGATLYRYGFGSGPYLFVPVLGPTTLRDLAGNAVDLFIDPFNQAVYSGSGTVEATRTGVSFVDARSRADSDLALLDTSAADPYATVRSIYHQRRAAELTGDEAAIGSLPDLPDDIPDAPVAPSPATTP